MYVWVVSAVLMLVKEETMFVVVVVVVKWLLVPSCCRSCLCGCRCIRRQEDILKEAFERLDVDSTGFISRDNLKAVLGKTYDNALIDKMLEVR